MPAAKRTTTDVPLPTPFTPPNLGAYTGKVVRIQPKADRTLFSLNTTGKTNYLTLLLEHPNYSSIFALLMASAVNKLPINVQVRGPQLEQVIAGIVDYVAFSFPA